MGTTLEPDLSAIEIRAARAVYASEAMPNLDLLRAVAVMLVLLSHLRFYFGIYSELGPLEMDWMGVVGVYFFFVHTCFVLMLSLERQWKGQSFLKLFGSFMIRRIFRIYPLSIAAVMIIVTFRLPLAGYYPGGGGFLAMKPAPFLVASNLLLIQRPEHSLLAVMWSLPYEVAMYLFLPALFLFLRPNRSVWRIFAVWLISVLVAAVCLHFAGGSKLEYFYLYIPCFLPGVIAYQMQKTPHPKLPGILWIGLIFAGVVCFLYKQDTVLSGRYKSWCLCIVIGVAVPFFAQLSANWITRACHIIAKYSYGIYLTHFFCIWLAFYRLHEILPRILRLGVFAVLVVGLPVLFYHFLEEPFILIGKLVAKRFEGAARPIQSAS